MKRLLNWMRKFFPTDDHTEWTAQVCDWSE